MEPSNHNSVLSSWTDQRKNTAVDSLSVIDNEIPLIKAKIYTFERNQKSEMKDLPKISIMNYILWMAS